MIKFTVFTAQITLFLAAVCISLHFLKIKNKKLILLCVACVTAFGLLAFYFADTYVKVTDEVTISVLKERNSKSKGTEINILNMQIDGKLLTSYDASQGKWYWISGRYSWRPPSDTRWNGTATNSITLRVPVGWTRTINFRTGTWSGFVEVKKPDGSKEVIDTYSNPVSFHVCYIGRSQTKLLILNGIGQIAAYGGLLLILTSFLIFTIKPGSDEHEKCKMQSQKEKRGKYNS